jgi:excisionase family DNA binding protein
MGIMTETDSVFLTTSQAALLLQVHESSVKRWSNTGDLKLEKTTGGHRRIRFDALLDFARAKAPGSDLLFFAPHEEEVARAALDARDRGNFAGVQELVLRFCDTEAPRWLAHLMRYFEGPCGIPMARLFDHGIAGALAEVGKQWQSGSRTIALEHRFTQKILDALHAVLVRLEDAEAIAAEVDLVTRASDSGSVLAAVAAEPGRRQHAVVGCSEGCHHEIGALMARILLQRAGWSVTYLGANVPFEEIAGIQELERAQLLCVSFVSPLGAGDVRRCLKVLNALRQPAAPYRLVVGGLTGLYGTEDSYETQIPLKFVDSMKGFEEWCATLYVPLRASGVAA